jgi:hypothetical protein
LRSKTKKGLSAALLAASFAVGGVMVAGPAHAGGNGTAYEGWFNASASTETWGGTQGRSYAQHGCKSFNSGWSTGSTSAWASCGMGVNSYANYYFA